MLAGRISFQSRDRGGFNHDLLHDRELDDIRSLQARAQLLFQPIEGNLSARLVIDYMDDESNGFHSVALDGSDPNTQAPGVLHAKRSDRPAARRWTSAKASPNTRSMPVTRKSRRRPCAGKPGVLH